MMHLLLIRHAIAMERDEFHRIDADDDLRPLTADGIKKMKKNALGLVELAKHIDVLVTSPLTRAVQTAEIVAAAFGGQAFRKRRELRPERPPLDFLEWLRNLPTKGTGDGKFTVAAIGHEPHLSHLASWLTIGHELSGIDLRKGGACLVDFTTSLDPGAAKLEWLMKPSQLRRFVR